ncbi:MAG: hypothetical protein OEW15_02655 [Nitrospirota bacterium]|nr:hypothetical protein [Nitrospirota bacterium]
MDFLLEYFWPGVAARSRHRYLRQQNNRYGGRRDMKNPAHCLTLARHKTSAQPNAFKGYSPIPSMFTKPVPPEKMLT